MSLKLIKITFIVIGLAYVLLPTDVLPDLFGLLGRLDDIIIVSVLYWKYRDIARKFVQKEKDYKQNRETKTEKNQAQEAPKSPYEILELEPGASVEQIEKNYRKLVAQYHPDKVDHLGEDLKKVAHEKMLQIQDAYEQLKKS